WISSRLHFLRGDFEDVEAFHRLDALLNELGSRNGERPNVLFYLAVGDRFFEPIVEQLGKAGMTSQSENTWRRVIIEKLFAHDHPPPRALTDHILRVLTEHKISRSDFSPGKKPAQNIMVPRFANGFFEPMWNRQHIEHVQITAAETVGVEQRGKFYEKTGALRDMVPNHVFQLLAMTAMEPPISFDADAVRNKKAEVVQAIRP